MGKHWQPRKQTVELQPGARLSRIRREPVAAASARKTLVLPAVPETWSGAAGVTALAVAIAVVTMGAGAILWPNAPPPPSQRFAQCYDADGPNCVVDGGAIRIQGERIAIAGLEAPQIQTARCAAERERGIDAALRLAALLNSGRVSVGPAFRDPSGREVRKVEVNGDDVAPALIADELARKAGSDPADWCSES